MMIAGSEKDKEDIHTEEREDGVHQIFLDREKVLRIRKKYWVFKRIQDVFLSILALVVLMPVFLVLICVIYIDSPGASPIFSQVRVGRDGKKFVFYKFRSMKPNAEEELGALLQYNEMQGPAFKIKNDPRITRVGRFIRKTAIDELPQLINIIKGDMSIVGPRPALPREVEQYDEYQKQRLLVQPGLTCFWQIQLNKNQMSFDEWMELDLKYIKESTLFVDWKIILGTFKAVIRMNGF